MKLTDEQYRHIGAAAVKASGRSVTWARLAAGKAAWAVAEPIAREHYLREMSDEEEAEARGHTGLGACRNLLESRKSEDPLDATVEAVTVMLEAGTSAEDIVAKVRELDARKEQP